jgi:CubicO group peptidase (beta-lactamase class C family)
MLRRQFLQLLAFAGTLVAAQLYSQSLPVGKPEDLGFSSARLAYIDEFYGDRVKKGELAGMVILVSRHGKIVHESAIGYADVEKHKKMEKNSIFRFYSMTKPITSTALMMLYEEGRFQLSDPVSKYLPQFGNLRVLKTPDSPFTETVPAEHQPTIQDILRHTGGFSHGLSGDAFDGQYDKAGLLDVNITLEEMMTRLSKLPLRNQPGTRFFYSVGPDIQARLIEVLSGMPFDVFLDKLLLAPLGMHDTAFWLGADKADRLVPVHWAKDGKLIPIDDSHGHPDSDIPLYQPWSVNSYTADHPRKGGSYGLVGTAEDYWRFAQMMLNSGQLDGKRYLSPQTVSFMAQDHLEPAGIPDFEKGKGFGLGFAVIRNQAAAGTMQSEGTFFWSGAAATSFWIDPKEGMVVVVMTQHMRVPATTALATQIPALVYGALQTK